MIKWILLFVLCVSGLITVATGVTVVLDIYAFATGISEKLECESKCLVINRNDFRLLLDLCTLARLSL
jgi:hypothetical protein